MLVFPFVSVVEYVYYAIVINDYLEFVKVKIGNTPKKLTPAFVGETVRCFTTKV